MQRGNQNDNRPIHGDQRYFYCVAICRRNHRGNIQQNFAPQQVAFSLNMLNLCNDRDHKKYQQLLTTEVVHNTEQFIMVT